MSYQLNVSVYRSSGGLYYGRYPNGQPTGISSAIRSKQSAVATTVLSINMSSLPQAAVGSPYTASINVVGGTGVGRAVYIVAANPNTHRWLQLTGPLTLGGIPQVEETSTVTLIATDDGGNVSDPVTLTLTSAATGALSYVTSALAGASASGVFVEPIIIAGGVPPYKHVGPGLVQPWYIDWDGFVYGAPTATGSVTIASRVVDAAGTVITRSFNVTVGSGIGLAGFDATTSQINLPPSSVGLPFAYNFWPFGGVGTGYVVTVTSGALAPGLALSGLAVTGTPTRAGAFFATVQISDGTNTASYTVAQQIALADAVTRPAYNTGLGFYVANGKLYGPTGKRAALRGTDRNHYDSASWANGANGALTAANVVRVFEFDGQTGAQAVTAAKAEYLPASAGGTSGNQIVPVLTLAFVGGTATSGSTDNTLLEAAMIDWFNDYADLSAIDGNVIYNIANEWGPTGVGWANAYKAVSAPISAISGSIVTVASGAATNPFASSPFCLIKGAGGIADVVCNISSHGGTQGAWTVTLSAAPTGTYTSGGTLWGGAVGVMRGAGYLGTLLIDAPGYGQSWADIVTYGATIQQSDPQQNVMFAYHAYGSATNFEATISSVARGTTTVVTLNSNTPYHPFAPYYPDYTSNNFLGTPGYVISGAQGMTQLNGAQPSTNNSIGGSQGAWTVSLTVDSSGWPTYTGNGRIVLQTNYKQVIQALAGLAASNVAVGVFEFGPGNQVGDHLTEFVGYISGTTLTVTSVVSGAIIPANVGVFGSGVNYLVTAANVAPAVVQNTRVLNQNSGTAGGVGSYTVDTSQTLGSSGSPVKMFLQSAYGNSTGGWYGAATGASPTDVSMGQLISACEAAGLPWAMWALDDHDLGPNQECSWLGWFGWENANTAWAVPSDLNPTGMSMVFNPRWGLRSLAAPIEVDPLGLPLVQPTDDIFEFMGSYEMPNLFVYGYGALSVTDGVMYCSGAMYDPWNSASVMCSGIGSVRVPTTLTGTPSVNGTNGAATVIQRPIRPITVAFDSPTVLWSVLDLQSFYLANPPSVGATSTPLASAWQYASGTYFMTFSTGETKNVTLTHGATTCTFSPGLSSAESTMVQVYQPPRPYTLGDTPLYATFTGEISGTTLTVDTLTAGTIRVGQGVSASGIVSGTEIIDGSGTTWTVNNAQNLTSRSMSSGDLTVTLSAPWPGATESFSFIMSNGHIYQVNLTNGSTVGPLTNGMIGYVGLTTAVQIYKLEAARPWGVASGDEFGGTLVYNGKLYINCGTYYDGACTAQIGFIVRSDTSLDPRTWGAINGIVGETPTQTRQWAGSMNTMPAAWQEYFGGPAYVASGMGLSVISCHVPIGFQLATFDPETVSVAPGNSVDLDVTLQYPYTGELVNAYPTQLAARVFSGPFPLTTTAKYPATLAVLPKAGDTSGTLALPSEVVHATGNTTAGGTTLTITSIDSGTLSQAWITYTVSTPGGNCTITPAADVGPGVQPGPGDYITGLNSVPTQTNIAMTLTPAGFANNFYTATFSTGESRIVTVASSSAQIPAPKTPGTNNPTQFSVQGPNGLVPAPLTGSGPNGSTYTTAITLSPMGDALMSTYNGPHGSSFFIPGSRTFIGITGNQYGPHRPRADACAPGASGSNSIPLTPDTVYYRRMQISAYDALDMISATNPWDPTPYASWEMPGTNPAMFSSNGTGPCILFGGLGFLTYDQTTSLIHACITSVTDAGGGFGKEPIQVWKVKPKT